MIDWTSVISGAIPAVIIAIVTLAIVLLFKGNIRRIKTKWGTATMNGRGIEAAYVIELLIEMVAILNQREELRYRRRTIVKRTTTQWRHNMAIFISEELSARGHTTNNLFRDPVYRYLMSVFDSIGQSLVGVIMTHAEKNGFYELDQESERSAYIEARIKELSSFIEEALITQFIANDDEIITQEDVLRWMQTRSPLIKALYSEMYRQIIETTLDIKARLWSYVERITLKGLEFGLNENEVDNIRNLVRRDILETL